MKRGAAAAVAAAPFLLLAPRIAVPAEEAPPAARRLEVLPRDISTRDLYLVMLDFNVGLGVGCGHCHVPGDPASDAHPEKEANRRRMRDLLEWNASATRRKPLTCRGCHEGKLVPDYATRPEGLGRLQELMRISGASSLAELFATVLEKGEMHGLPGPDGAAAPRASPTAAPPAPPAAPPPPWSD